MIEGRTILCFASGYDAPPTSKHHVMHLLAERNTVLWVNYHASRTPTASSSDLLYMARKLGQVAAGLQRARRNLYVLTPLVIPLPSSPWARQANRALLMAQIRTALARLRRGPLQIWSFTPDVAYALGQLGEERAVYYCVDDHASFTGHDAEQVRRDEEELCRRAGLVVTTSTALQEAKQPFNPNTILVPHGVDYEHFSKAVTDNLPTPADLADIPRPRLGFFGLIRDWVDLDLLADVARQRPDWHIVMIGDSTVDLSPYRSISNIHFLGRKPYADLPAYCKQFDVGLIPFKVNELTRAVNPIKLREYLAAGLPVVSTPMPEVEPSPGDVSTADGHQEFLGAVEALLDRGITGRAARSAIMAEHTWQERLRVTSDRLGVERVAMSVASQHPLGDAYESCTGCGACVAKCPKGCIRLRPDAEGFLHPQIRLEECVDCGLCREVCPACPPLYQQRDPREPQQVLAAWHLDERIRHESSSGGAFTALAQAAFRQGGVVVGAAFDEDLVVRHVLIETSAELHSLRGSKYVQSEMPAELYRSIQDLLERGRTVLFSGTPCQVAGLRGFLGTPRERLLCCDLVCHGVPSPLLLASYLRHNQDNGCRIASISFRDKTCGWKAPSVRLDLECGGSKISDYASANPYTVAFVRNYSLRPSCYACRFTNTDRTGDLTIADFWGVGSRYPQYDRDDRGTSLVLVNTEAGQKWLDACREHLFLGAADLDTALVRNPMLWRPAPRPPKRDSFYRDLVTLPFSDLVRRYRLHRPSVWQRSFTSAKRKIKRVLRRFLRNRIHAERKPS